MAEISKITLPTGTTYDIKDATARAAIANLHEFSFHMCHNAADTPLGVTGYANISATPTSYTGTLAAGDADHYTIYLVLASTPSESHPNNLFDEYIAASVSGYTSQAQYVWEKVGSIGSAVISDLGDLAYKDSASGSFTPEGTINVVLSTATKYVASSTTGGGSATEGTAAQCTLPVFSTSVSDETLTLGWTAGSFTPNTPTAVTMPTFASQKIANGTVSTKTFTGTAGTVTVS